MSVHGASGSEHGLQQWVAGGGREGQLQLMAETQVKVVAVVIATLSHAVPACFHQLVELQVDGKQLTQQIVFIST